MGFGVQGERFGVGVWGACNDSRRDTLEHFGAGSPRRLDLRLIKTETFTSLFEDIYVDIKRHVEHFRRHKETSI